MDKRDWFIVKAAVNREVPCISCEHHRARMNFREPNDGSIAKIHFRIFRGNGTEMRDMIRKHWNDSERASFD